SDYIIIVPFLQSLTNDSTIIAEASPETYYPTASFDLPKGQLFYFKMNDISMEPMIPKEANVLIKIQNETNDEQIVAVTLNDNPTLFLRKIRKQDGFILLLAENPDYAPIIVTKEDSMKVVGKAIRVSYDI
ncbi:MAG: S24 family peptidase, partial [Tetragenococcus halophilus]|nr:S24 family peptidase [Tetragenococcus halophilus]